MEAQRLTVALETFRPSGRAVVGRRKSPSQSWLQIACRSDPARCTPLSLLAAARALGGESWTGVNGSPDQPVTTLTVRYADAAADARHELLKKRVALARCSAVRLTFPPFEQARRGFHHRRRSGQRLLPVIGWRMHLVGHGTRYDFYVRRYANTLTWTWR